MSRNGAGSESLHPPARRADLRAGLVHRTPTHQITKRRAPLSKTCNTTLTRISISVARHKRYAWHHSSVFANLIAPSSKLPNPLRFLDLPTSHRMPYGVVWGQLSVSFQYRAAQSHVLRQGLRLGPLGLKASSLYISAPHYYISIVANAVAHL